MMFMAIKAEVSVEGGCLKPPNPKKLRSQSPEPKTLGFQKMLSIPCLPGRPSDTELFADCPNPAFSKQSAEKVHVRAWGFMQLDEFKP